MNDCKVSVVVPVYNSEKSLPRCVESILSQTYKDFELILINDGSTDGSQAICEDYARDDDRIISVIKKKNGGVSSCRQLGLELMKGKYVQFIDSDDYIEENCLEENLRIAEAANADIVISDFFVDGKDGLRCRRQEYRGDLIDDFFSGRIFGALWNKLIRTELIRKSGVSFCYGLSFCEDLTFLCELAINTHNMRIEMNPKAYYHYCINTNSLTSKVTKSKLENEESYIGVMTRVLQQRGKTVYFQSNHFSIAWGYLKLGILPFNEYRQKLSKVYLYGDGVSLSKRIVLSLSGSSIGYAIITRLLRKKKHR